MTYLALGAPALSMWSKAYHPARPEPILMTHGQTARVGALIVMAWVMVH